VATVSTRKYFSLLNSRDFLATGDRGQIEGHVYEDGNPLVPVSRYVYLLTRGYPTIVSITQSDKTGYYKFSSALRVDGTEYTIYSVDPNASYNATIRDRITPGPYVA